MRLQSIRPRFTYANVASSLALFVALGGTSYALTLPHNSVGAKQLRAGSVRGSEIRDRSVRSIDLRNGTIALKDIAAKARASLRGRPGPTGPPGPSGANLFIESDSGGGHQIGNGTMNYLGGNTYRVSFPRSVAACALAASPATVPGGLTPEAPAGSTVIVAHEGDNALVRTFNAANDPQGLPFSLIAAC